MKRINPLPDDKILDWSKLKQVHEEKTYGKYFEKRRKYC